GPSTAATAAVAAEEAGAGPPLSAEYIQRARLVQDEFEQFFRQRDEIERQERERKEREEEEKRENEERERKEKEKMQKESRERKEREKREKWQLRGEESTEVLDEGSGFDREMAASAASRAATLAAAGGTEGDGGFGPAAMTRYDSQQQPSHLSTSPSYGSNGQNNGENSNGQNNGDNSNANEGGSSYQWDPVDFGYFQ
ncbi:hypothetical protein DBV05_g11347, partial [Lasiodiplodia theobromae]